ncbi:hypothetical protein CAP51_14360 [Acinetobacter populi]|uniref:YitT family protein n=2 Tax=Acinetobacter populi TaxID=1582270 RepID=A0A1Z9YUR5_9GAMM|nr:hypothetical protein CAP51_14360 [Acinetobacter populi]
MNPPSSQHPVSDPATRIKSENRPVVMPHSTLEDILALLTGTFILSFALNLIQQTGLMMGGTMGLALLLHYISHIQFGLLFFLVNSVFFYLAYKKMGLNFVIKTIAAIGLVYLFTEITPHFIHIQMIHPFYTAIIANLLIGIALLILFRHKSSLGGINILALYMQQHYKISAGKFQMIMDLSILFISSFFMDIHLLLISLIGAVILNLVITMNHKDQRYIV